MSDINKTKLKFVKKDSRRKILLNSSIRLAHKNLNASQTLNKTISRNKKVTQTLLANNAELARKNSELQVEFSQVRNRNSELEQENKKLKMRLLSDQNRCQTGLSHEQRKALLDQYQRCNELYQLSYSVIENAFSMVEWIPDSQENSFLKDNTIIAPKTPLELTFNKETSIHIPNSSQDLKKSSRLLNATFDVDDNMSISETYPDRDLDKENVNETHTESVRVVEVNSKKAEEIKYVNKSNMMKMLPTRGGSPYPLLKKKMPFNEHSDMDCSPETPKNHSTASLHNATFDLSSEEHNLVTFSNDLVTNCDQFEVPENEIIQEKSNSSIVTCPIETHDSSNNITNENPEPIFKEASLQTTQPNDRTEMNSANPLFESHDAPSIVMANICDNPTESLNKASITSEITKDNDDAKSTDKEEAPIKIKKKKEKSLKTTKPVVRKASKSSQNKLSEASDSLLSPKIYDTSPKVKKSIEKKTVEIEKQPMVDSVTAVDKKTFKDPVSFAKPKKKKQLMKPELLQSIDETETTTTTADRVIEVKCNKPGEMKFIVDNSNKVKKEKKATRAKKPPQGGGKKKKLVKKQSEYESASEKRKDIFDLSATMNKTANISLFWPSTKNIDIDEKNDSDQDFNDFRVVSNDKENADTNKKTEKDSVTKDKKFRNESKIPARSKRKRLIVLDDSIESTPPEKKKMSSIASGSSTSEFDRPRRNKIVNYTEPKLVTKVRQGDEDWCRK